MQPLISSVHWLYYRADGLTGYPETADVDSLSSFHHTLVASWCKTLHSYTRSLSVGFFPRHWWFDNFTDLIVAIQQLKVNKVIERIFKKILSLSLLCECVPVCKSILSKTHMWILTMEKGERHEWTEGIKSSGELCRHQIWYTLRK